MKHRTLGSIKKVFGVPDSFQLGLRYMTIKFYFMAEMVKFRMSYSVCANLLFHLKRPFRVRFQKCLIEICHMDFENT